MLYDSIRLSLREVRRDPKKYMTRHGMTELFIQEATTKIQKLPEEGNREVNPVYKQFP